MKNHKTFLLLILFSSFIMLFYYGCTTGGTVRYGTNHEDDNEKKSSVRFTSADDSMIVDLNLDLTDPSDLPSDEPEVPITTLMNKYENPESPNIPGFDYTTLRERMLMEIIKYLDTPYKYGGTTKDGIDCSAFTQTVFKDVLSINLERSARLQFNQGTEVDAGDLKFGDLVFFNTRKRVKPGHVGIYIGDRLFAHASSTKGVTISSLDLSYYSQRFMGARRIDNNGITRGN